MCPLGLVAPYFVGEHFESQNIARHLKNLRNKVDIALEHEVLSVDLMANNRGSGFENQSRSQI